MKLEWEKEAGIKGSPIHTQAVVNIPVMGAFATDAKAEIEFSPTTYKYTGTYFTMDEQDGRYDMDISHATSLDNAIELAETWLSNEGII